MIKTRVTEMLGVELFVRGDEVWFSEVSPRPHDTGLVTLRSQRLSEFELHARAILGLPVDTSLCAPGASAVGAASQLPLTRDDLNCSFVIEGRPQPKLGDYPSTQYRTASADYFRALRIPLRSGRCAASS